MNTRTADKPAVRSRISRLATVLLFLAALVAVPAISRADDKADAVDGRLEGYPQGATLPDPGGTVPTWMFFGLLATLTLGVLFINSKRTHLD